MRFILTPTQLNVLRDLPVDAFDVEMKVRDFYTILNSNKQDITEEIYRAKSILDTARALVMGLIIAEENQYIMQYEDKYRWLLDNQGRVDQRIFELQEDTIKAATSKQFAKNVDINPGLVFSKCPEVYIYLNQMVKYMEILVYYPLKNAYQSFMNLPEDILKDKELYLYKLFVELSNAYESLGSITAEKVKTTPKQPGISYNQPSHSELGEEHLPSIPKDVKLKEDNAEVALKKAIDYFGEEGLEVEFPEEEDDEDNEDDDED